MNFENCMKSLDEEEKFNSNSICAYLCLEFSHEKYAKKYIPLSGSQAVSKWISKQATERTSEWVQSVTTELCIDDFSQFLLFFFFYSLENLKLKNVSHDSIAFTFMYTIRIDSIWRVEFITSICATRNTWKTHRGEGRTDDDDDDYDGKLSQRFMFCEYAVCFREEKFRS